MEKKYYLITGASSGIGRATVETLDKLGACCVMIARDEEKLQKVRSGLGHPDNHLIIPYELRDMEHYGEMFKLLKKKGVLLSGMVHCAGITKVTPLRTFSMNQAMELFEIHFFAFLELIKWYSKKGVSDGGSIVGVSAINAHVPQKCMTAYASAKSAVEGACRTLALELSEKGIRINTVVVGGISGGMGADLRETVDVAQTVTQGDGHTRYVNPVSRQLLGVGTPSQIADVITFLLSDGASFITGREIYADGGLF